MITTYRQLLTETLAKYENAKALNRRGRTSTCSYQPVFNEDGMHMGIGCGLGVHIDPAKAKVLDSATGPTGIQYLYGHEEYKPFIDEVFDVKGIGMNHLQRLQFLHDNSSAVDEFRNKLTQAIAELPELRVLVSRLQQFSPFGQLLTFDDGSTEFDPECAQTTPVLTAELYNGRAAKNSTGAWVHAPGVRLHEYTDGLLAFAVGLTFLKIDTQGKAVYDYSVITPTGVEFHGDEETGNVLHVPCYWGIARTMGEAVAWMCLGEDTAVEFPSNTTPEQWEWIRSDEREVKEAEIDEWIEHFDRRTVLAK